MHDKRYILFGAVTVISSILYYWMGYQVLRHEHVSLISGYALLFLLYILIFRYFKDIDGRILFASALILRLILIASVPALSDDVWRFIWDGRLWAAGIHPFSHIPVNLMSGGEELPPGIDKDLFLLLNSQTHYTIYPPVSQFIFLGAGYLFPNSEMGSIVFIRIPIILLEAGTLMMMRRLLRISGLPEKNWILYAFNPLVILELTGNLHFEAGVIFFLLVAVYYMYRKSPLPSGLHYALSISSKLIPLLFAPLFMRYWNYRKSILFFLVSGIATFALFLPLLDPDLLIGMEDSLLLYFRKFEFNASLYFIIREIGFMVKGYNIIGTAGPWMAGITFIFVILYTIVVNPQKTNIMQSMMWLLFIYLLMSTTVHPWYITPLIALSIFTGYRFPIVWSGLIFLTYTGYSLTGYSESIWVSLVEYGTVLLMFGIEYSRSAYFLELNHKIRSLTR